MSRAVQVGQVVIGGGAPIAVQSMTNTDTRDVAATVAQIRRLQGAGCELVRVAVPDAGAAAAIRAIRHEVTLPIVADIHYDHRLALAALDAGADKLRLNPGNIQDPEAIRAVARAAGARDVPIRVGVNAGSLPERFQGAKGEVTPQGLLDAALWEVELLEQEGFRNIVVAIKAHHVPMTVEANRLLARATDYPLHLGITEAGPRWSGAIRSSVGLGLLLAEGIGDTIRVSLSGDPLAEVEAAWEILRALELRSRGPGYIVCPTCGRTGIDIPGIAEEVRAALQDIEAPLRIAIMGCPVNGLGEARHADYAILGGRGCGSVYAQGEVVATRVPEDRLVQEFVLLVRRQVMPLDG